MLGVSQTSAMGNAEYKATVLGAISEVLRAAGFRKSGSVFRRPVGDVLHMASLQSSSSSTAGAVRLTVNLAVWVPALAHGRAPDIWAAHWRERLGFLMPDRGDRWWHIASGTEAVSASHEIGAAISKWALPELDRLSSAEALGRLWRSGVSPGLTNAQAERFLLELSERPPAG